MFFISKEEAIKFGNYFAKTPNNLPKNSRCDKKIVKNQKLETHKKLEEEEVSIKN